MRSDDLRVEWSTPRLSRSATSAISKILQASGMKIKLLEDPFVETSFENGVMKSLAFTLIVEVQDKKRFPDIMSAEIAIAYEVVFPSRRTSRYVATEEMRFESEANNFSRMHVQRKSLEREVQTVIDRSLKRIIRSLAKECVP